MRRLGQRVARGMLRFVLILAVLLGGLHLLTMAKLSDAEVSLHPTQADRVLVVDHGYHSGLVISTTLLRKAAVGLDRTDSKAAARVRWLASLYPDANWIEIGWGDAAFYQRTPHIGDVDVLLGLKAILLPTKAVLQIVPGWGPVDDAFPMSNRAMLGLSEDGLIGLSQRLAETVPDPVPTVAIGPSLYGYGAFFPAELDYHLLRTCNHWVAWLLRGAGAPTSPVPGTFSVTLMAELRWRTKWGK